MLLEYGLLFKCAFSFNAILTLQIIAKGYAREFSETYKCYSKFQLINHSRKVEYWGVKTKTQEYLTHTCPIL